MTLTVVILLIAALNNKTEACGYSFTTNYYMFDVFKTSTTANESRYITFWQNYVGTKINPWDISALEYLTEEDLHNPDSYNPIVTAALKKNDTEMLSYLEDLTAYHRINSSRYDDWEYPSEAELQQFAQKRKDIYQHAIAYNGTKLKDRYTLMAMRCLFQDEEYSKVEELWLSSGAKASDQDCRKTMMELFAGALYHQGKTAAAINIFMELGSLQDVKFCLDKKRDLNGIKEVYARDHNNPALVFLVEDFVNMFQETIDGESGPWDFYTVTNKQAREFVNFANEIADKKASNTPLLWKEAAVLVSFYLKDFDNAKKYAAQMSSLQGTECMKDNARLIKFFVSTYDQKYTSANAAYYLSEFKWLESKFSDPFFKNAWIRIAAQNIAAANYDNTNFITLVSNTVFFINEKFSLENLTIPQLESFLNFFSNSKKADEFERYLIQKSEININQINDYIGIRYLGEMDLDKAEAAFSKVPVHYYASKAIGNYMMQRDYHIERWFTTQEWIDDYSEGDEPPLKSNQRLEYTKELKSAIAKYNTSTGDERCNLAYKLAAMCYQASFWGNCWYLLENSWSIDDKPSDGQKLFEQKALTYLNVASNLDSDWQFLKNSYYAIAWIKWRNYEYFDAWWYNDNQNPTAEMNTAMSNLKSCFDKKFGVGNWEYACDYLMDYVRAH